MPDAATSLRLLTASGPDGYALLDSGHGRKLERFGRIVVDRPEPQALWRQRLSPAEWQRAHAVFSALGDDDEKGKWRVDKPVPEFWPVAVDGVTMHLKLSGLWHLGLFPEQLPHWQWMRGCLPVDGGSVLNLFGYTGAASLIAAKAGAQVVHVDASRKAIAWGRENQEASGLADKPVRWICEDARKFVAREVRRGRRYHCILVDPPKFGRGPDREVWELFEHLPALLADCRELLAPGDGSHLVLTAYAIRASALALDGLMRDTFADRGGVIESGELALVETSGGRLLPTSMFSRWSGGDAAAAQAARHA
ncbi:MAG: class I SAM-dependent methyltransferase [Hyphomicrobiaceae bacterium]